MIYCLSLQNGIEVCRGATPSEQGVNHPLGLVFRQSGVSFRQTKQNSFLHRVHVIFLHFSVLWLINKPHVIQARTAGHTIFPAFFKIIVAQSLSRSRSLLLQPSLSHRSDRGRWPFHSLKHCQQNSKVRLFFTVQMVHFTQRLDESDLSMIQSQPGHWNRQKEQH